MLSRRWRINVKAMPSQPIAHASVTTPETPQKPTGHMWDKLYQTRDRDALLELDRDAERQGFTKTGQLRMAILEAREALLNPKAEPAKKKAARPATKKGNRGK